MSKRSRPLRATTSSTKRAPAIPFPITTSCCFLVIYNFVTIVIASHIIVSALEFKVRFKITESAVLDCRIDLLDCSMALGITVIQSQRKPAVRPIFHAGIVEVRQRSRSRGRTPCVAEGPGLEGASSAVPGIDGVGQ